MRPVAARVVALIRVDAIWLAVEPLDMRAGTETILARVVKVFGAARPHHAYLFANKSSTRMKVLVYDGFGIWLAARRLQGALHLDERRPGDRHGAQSRAIACAGDGAALADAHPRPRDHGRVIPPKP